MFSNFRYLFLLLVLTLLQFNCRETEPNSPENGPLTELTKLSADINESSGLLYLQNEIWTINDGGDNAHIYKVSEDDDVILNTTIVQDANNIDWEDLAADNEHVYIGDFGNNSGNRQDLGIYKINRSDLTQDFSSSTPIEYIPFVFEDQTDFEPGNNHNFDCEAMFVFNNEMYLFSKNRGNLRSKLYKVFIENNISSAKLQGDFDSEGLITAADFHPTENKLALLGYHHLSNSEFAPFIWILSDFSDDQFFTGQLTKHELDIKTQVEGIAWKSTNELLISCEAEGGGKGRLYSFEVE